MDDDDDDDFGDDEEGVQGWGEDGDGTGEGEEAEEDVNDESTEYINFLHEQVRVCSLVTHLDLGNIPL